MIQPKRRPDTPLAATPEPQVVTSGFQSAPQVGRVPQQRVESKYEKTANNAIQQIDLLSKMKAASAAPAAPQPNQQQ
jgi:hypothetical protein